MIKIPYATTHILVAVILIELFRDYFIKNNKKFPRYYIIIVAIGAVLPDFDIGVYYVLYFLGFGFEQVHKTFSHTIFVPLILITIGLFTLNFKITNKKIWERHLKISNIFFIFAFGSFLHLVLDAMFYNHLTIFYPISKFSMGFDILLLFPENLQKLILPTIDGILLIFWIFWMEFKIKINNYF